MERSRRIQGYAYDAVTKDLGYDYNRPWKNKNPYYVEPEPIKEKKFCKAPAAGKEGSAKEEGKEGGKEEKKEEKKAEKKEEKKEAKAEAKKEGAGGDAPAEAKAGEGNATNSTEEAECIPLPAAGNATNATATEAPAEGAAAEAAPAELLAKKNTVCKKKNPTTITLK